MNFLIEFDKATGAFVAGILIIAVVVAYMWAIHFGPLSLRDK